MAIVVKTAPYHGDGAGYAALAVESTALSYQLSHEFNRPCVATVILSDVSGDMLKKYSPLESACYIGPGKLQIEDPAATIVFQGRIVDAKRSKDGRTTLVGEDWLSELDEERIDYDCREDLNNSGLRQSELHGTLDEDPIGGLTGPSPTYTNAGTYYAIDRNATFANDEFNGMYMVLSKEHIGSQTIVTGPYARNLPDALETETGTYIDTWFLDGTVHAMHRHAQLTVDYYFRIFANEGSLMSGDVTAIRIKLYCQCYAGSENADVYIYDATGDDFETVGTISNGATSTEPYKSYTITVPSDKFAKMQGDSDGLMKIRISVPAVGGLEPYLNVDLCNLEVDLATTAHSSLITINDTTANHVLTVATDLSITGLGLWEGCPYCVARPIYKHIASDETPGTLVTNGDALFELTCAGNIEHTTGVSTRHFTNRTRYEIMKELAEIDRAVFWIPVGTTEIYWQKRFEANDPPAMTDATVLSWLLAEYDYKPMRNECIVQGARVNDKQVEATSSDATSQTTYGRIRTHLVNDSGCFTDIDAGAIGASAVAKNKDVKLGVEAELSGLNTTFKLGTQVTITSSYLSSSTTGNHLDGNGEDDYFVVTKWVYDSRSWRTMIELKPRGLVGFSERAVYGQNIRNTIEQTRTHTMDIVSPDLTTHSWTNP